VSDICAFTNLAEKLNVVILFEVLFDKIDQQIIQTAFII